LAIKLFNVLLKKRSLNKTWCYCWLSATINCP